MDRALMTDRLPDPDREAAFYDGVLIKRGIAWFVDIALIALLAVLVLPFTAFIGIFFFPALMLVLGFLYRWVTIANQSATWGMRLMGIELRDIDGHRLTAGLALAHTGAYTFALFVAPLQLISVGAMLVTPRGQGLHDLFLGTAMLNRAA
ncbi:RDD family protein [Aestuariibius sp. 2305UL40-4]|uniref:RDD family protein n=1 Tax=Aestuariibius violaceus TaxID=3234132 RepID=UPI003493C5C2